MVVWKVNLNCQLIHCKTIAKSILIQEKKKRLQVERIYFSPCRAFNNFVLLSCSTLGN